MISVQRREFVQIAAGVATAALLPTVVRSAEKPTLKVLLFGGALPEVEKKLAEKFALHMLKGGQTKTAQAQEDNVSGLEQLPAADLWIGSANKRTFPNEKQLKHFQDSLAAGKPFVGYRAASHVFQNWLQADQAVFGAKYGGHHLLNKDPVLVIETVDGQADHPILKGLTPPRPASGSYVYTEVSPDVTVLLRSGLAGDMMPHTWVREDKETKGRVFYTRYDAKELARNEVCREIFLRGIAWALNRG